MLKQQIDGSKVKKPKRNIKPRSLSTDEVELKISIANEETQQYPRQMSSNNINKEGKQQIIPDSSSQKEYSHYLAELLSKHREKQKQQNKTGSSSSSFQPISSNNELAQFSTKQQQQQNQSQKMNSKKQIKNKQSLICYPDESYAQIKLDQKSMNKNAKIINEDGVSINSSKKDSVASFQTGYFAMESKETQLSPGSFRENTQNKSQNLTISKQKSANQIQEDSSIPSGILQRIQESVIFIPQNSIRINSAKLQSRISNQTNLKAQSITLSPRSHSQKDYPQEQSSLPLRTLSSISIQSQNNPNQNIQNVKVTNQNNISLGADTIQSQGTLNTRIRSGINRSKTIEQQNNIISASSNINGVFRIKSTKGNNGSQIISQGKDQNQLNNYNKGESNINHNNTNNHIPFPFLTPIHPNHIQSSQNQPFSNSLLKSSSVEITNIQEQQQQFLNVQIHKRNASSFQKRFDPEGNQEKEPSKYLIRPNTAKLNSQLSKNNTKTNNSINSTVNNSSNHRSLSQASDYKQCTAEKVYYQSRQSQQTRITPQSRLLSSSDQTQFNQNTNILTTSLPHLEGIIPPQPIIRTEGDQIYSNDRYSSQHNNHQNSKYQMYKNWLNKSTSKNSSSNRQIERSTGAQSWQNEDEDQEEQKDGKFRNDDKKRISIKFEDISSKNNMKNFKQPRSHTIDEASGSAEMSSKNSQCYSDYVRSIYDSNSKQPQEIYKIQRSQKNNNINQYHGEKQNSRYQQQQLHDSQQMYKSQSQDDQPMTNMNKHTNETLKSVNVQKIDVLEQLSVNLSLSQQKYQQNQLLYQYKQPVQQEQIKQPQIKQYQKQVPQQFFQGESYQEDRQLGEVQGHNMAIQINQKQQQQNKLKIALPPSNQQLKCFFNSSIQQSFLDRPLVEFSEDAKQFNDQNLQSNWASNLKGIQEGNNYGNYQSISSLNSYDNSQLNFPLKNIRSISSNGDYYKVHNNNNQYSSLDLSSNSNNSNPRDNSAIRRQLIPNRQQTQYFPLSCFENSLIKYNNQPLFNPSIQLPQQSHDSVSKVEHQLYTSYSASKPLNNHAALEKTSLSSGKSKFPRDIFTPNVKSMRKKLSQPL